MTKHFIPITAQMEYDYIHDFTYALFRLNITTNRPYYLASEIFLSRPSFKESKWI